MSNDNEYMREYMREYASKRRDRIHAMLGDVCVKCGTDQDLEIHHKDPKQKSFTLASCWSRAWDKLVAEAKKCELLCDPCHALHHKSKYPHGTVQRYWRGCHCEPCQEDRRRHQREYLKSKRP